MASSQTKSRRSRYFNRDGPLPSPNTREPKKNTFWCRANGTLPSQEPPSRLPWSFSFLFFFFSRPLHVATDHLPWSFSFLFFSVGTIVSDVCVCVCDCLWRFVGRERMTNKICDLWWFVTGLAIFFVICDEISNIFCESQTQIKTWQCSILSEVLAWLKRESVFWHEDKKWMQSLCAKPLKWRSNFPLDLKTTMILVDTHTSYLTMSGMQQRNH